MVPLQWARRAVANLAHHRELGFCLLALPGWLVALLAVLFITPLGIMPINAAVTRLLTHSVRPGDLSARRLRASAAMGCRAPRRAASGVRSVAGAPFVLWYARLLGARIGKGVNLHALPPVTGLVRLDDYCSIEAEVNLSGYWVDGDVLHVGEITVGKDARVGARSTLLPGTRIGDHAHIEAGSTVTGEKRVKDGARWAGSPAHKGAPSSTASPPNARRQRDLGWVSAMRSPLWCSP